MRRAEKLIDLRIDKAYRVACSGVAVNIMDIPKIFAFGKQKIAEGEDDGALAASIGAYVRTIAVKLVVLAVLAMNIPAAHADQSCFQMPDGSWRCRYVPPGDGCTSSNPISGCR